MKKPIMRKAIISFFLIMFCFTKVFALTYESKATININKLGGKPEIKVVSTELDKNKLAPGDVMSMKVVVNNNTTNNITLQFLGGFTDFIPSSNFTATVSQNGEVIYSGALFGEKACPFSLIEANGKLTYEINVTYDINATNQAMNKSAKLSLKFMTMVDDSIGRDLSFRDKLPTGSIMIIYVICAVLLICIVLILLIILKRRKKENGKTTGTKGSRKKSK